MILLSLSSVCAFVIGYKISNYRNSKDFKSKCNNFQFLNNHIDRLESERRSNDLKLKEQSKKEFDEWLSKQPIKFHESLESQPLLKVPNLDERGIQFGQVAQSNTEILYKHIRKNQ